MILYHGTNRVLDKIDLSKGRKYKDFGQGFYTTHLREQAVAWSKQVADRFGGNPVVNEYEFDLDSAIADGLKVKIFDKPNQEWAEFVIANRKKGGKEFRHDYDIVIGPVADDDIARIFGLYDMNIIDLAAVVVGLTYKKLNSQYFFGTERSLKYIKKI